MPLDSLPSSPTLIVPPPPSTVRALSSGSPSSTSKVQAIVVEELALASMGPFEAAAEIAGERAIEPRDLVDLWAQKRVGRRRSIDAVQVVKGEARIVDAWRPPARVMVAVAIAATLLGVLAAFVR